MKVENLKLLIRAGNPIISIETTDEPRAVRVVRQVAEQLGQPLMEWSITGGLVQTVPPGGPPPLGPGKVLPALRRMKEASFAAIYLFKDLGAHCRDPQVVRFLRDLYFSTESRLWTLVLVDGGGLPPEVRRLTVPFDVGWPDEEELRQVIRSVVLQARDRELLDVKVKLTRRQVDELVQTLRGLTTEEAARVISAAIHDDNVLDAADLPRIVDAKRNRLATTGCLQSIVADVSPDDIGGLENLKRWLHQRRGGFTAEARQFGLEPPRGVLLLGVQGCGKSLCAKVIASGWQMPLLRMDPGVLYQKFIGESEARLREALNQAESLAPVVLWIDEIEKAFASASTESADGGLSQRMFGTLLAWMQDHRQPIFIVATANDIHRLPPELMRKGRFDEIFFIDLPRAAQRKEIFAIHLRKRRRDPQQFDLDRLSAATEGFSGSEIEQAIISALYAAFSEGRDCTTEDILEAVRATQPLSVVMRERIEALRAWARGRCVPAD